jgi:hypothetical protein
VSGKSHYKLGVVCACEKVETHLSLFPTHGFVSHVTFAGGVTPSNGAVVRSSFKDAKNSKLTPHGFSHFERYEREMQSVNASQDDKVAFDSTFQTTKKCNSPGADAVFTGNKEGTTKEIVTLATVPTTAASQTSHLLLQSREKRKQFKPAVLCTDTCPHNEQFWKATFGTYLETKLGLFRLLHPTMDNINSQ